MAGRRYDTPSTAISRESEPERTTPGQEYPKSYSYNTPMDDTQKTDENTLVGIDDFGLYNMPGQLNCFLNVILQSFWHLNIFRKVLIQYAQRDQFADDNAPIMQIIEALKTVWLSAIMSQGDSKDILVFSPIIIRRELFKLFYASDLFNLNAKADTAEAFSTLLQLLHGSLCPNFGYNEKGLNLDESCQSENEGQCFIHQIFQLNTVIKRKCKCGKQFEPERATANNFQLIASSRAVLNLCDEEISRDKYSLYGNSMSVIHQKLILYVQSELTNCQDICVDPSCTIKQTKEDVYLDTSRTLPQVIALNINWEQQEVKPSDIAKLLLSIPSVFNISELFQKSPSNPSSQNFELSKYKFKGFVSYVGAHYLAYFRTIYKKQYSSYTTDLWKLYNDDSITEFESWTQIVLQCAETQQRPTLLYFEKLQKEPNYLDDDSLKIANYYIEEIQRKVKRMDIYYQGQGGIADMSTSDIEYQRMLYSQLASKSQKEEQKSAQIESKQQVEIPQHQDPEEYMELQYAKLKKEFLSQDGVYLYNCERCPSFIMLHMQQCQQCSAENSFYQPDLQKPPDDIHQTILQRIRSIYEEANEIKQKNTSAINITIETPEVAMADHTNENHSADNASPDSFKKIDSLEEKQLPKVDETEWFCEQCGSPNFIIYDDIYSSFCAQCNKLNENIDIIIKEYKRNEYKQSMPPLTPIYKGTFPERYCASCKYDEYSKALGGCMNKYCRDYHTLLNLLQNMLTRTILSQRK